MEQIEQMIADYFNKRYDYLTKCAGNILKLIQRPDLKSELVSECYMYIYKNKEKLKDKILDNKLEAILVNYMTMQVKWNETNFKKNNITKEFLYYDQEESDQQNVFINHPANTYDEVEVDFEEKMERDMDIEQKLLSIELGMLNQTLDKKILYEQVFEQGYNTSGKLSKHTGIPRTNCYILIKNLKAQLRNRYESEDNLNT